MGKNVHFGTVGKNKTLDYHTKCQENQTKTNVIWYHLYVESKNNVNEIIYKTETDSQMQKTHWWLPKGKREGRDKLRVWD